MNVYLIRHGQTEGNKQGFHQGWGNTGLNETGLAQANILREYLKDKEYDRIICSDLQRTRQTYTILFGDRKDENVQYDGRLREINNSVIEGKTRDEMYKIYGDEYIENCHRLDYSAYGGESAVSMLNRTADFLSSLEKDSESGEVAVVTHGGTILAILSNILKMPLTTTKLKIDNCSITKLRFEENNWTVRYINKTEKRTDE